MTNIMDTNHTEQSLNDSRFDRLVDGELNEQERQELLSRLDREQGGWRRCALAFLEAQCWKQEVGAIFKRQALAVSTPSTMPGTVLLRHTTWFRQVAVPLGLAASLLVALWAGAALQQLRVGQPAGSGIGQLAENAAMRSPSPQPLAQPAADPWRVVTVSTPPGADNEGMSFNLPAVERDNLDPQWLQSLPPAIPENVLQAFHRTGHQVQQHREFVPIPLNDGRQLVVPVDQVEVKYVPNQSY